VLGDWEGAQITANIGRFGPFVSHNGTYANLESIEEVFTVGGNRAIELLTAKREGRGGGGRGRFGAAARQILKDLGEHPEGGKIQVLNGRYGPYVNWGKSNANIPRGAKPEEVSLDQAVALLAERAAKGPAKKPARTKAKAAAKDDAPKGEASPRRKAATRKSAEADET
jgi:DNA topoisomerase-1